MNHCKNLYLKTKDDFFWWEGTDVSGIDPYNELNDLKLHFQISTFPNAAVVLRKLLTLPVSLHLGKDDFLNKK